MNNIDANKIAELYPGYFYSLLGFLSRSILPLAVDHESKYTWLINYSISQAANSIQFKNNESIDLLNIRGQVNLVMRTQDFIDNLESFTGSLHLIQSDVAPPRFPEPNSYNSKAWHYLLFGMIDYNVEIILPSSTDYTPYICKDYDRIVNLIQEINE